MPGYPGMPYTDCPPEWGQGPIERVDGNGRYPADIFYDTDSRLDLVITELVRHSWVRFEYLHWNIQDPGNDLLGARMNLINPRELHQAFDPGNLPRLGVFTFVPDLSDAQFNNLNGIRGTIGVSTRAGSLEIDAWNIGQTAFERTIDPEVDFLTGAVIIPSVSLLSAGTPSDSTMILFDDGYRAELRANLFGSQGNWYFNPGGNGSIINFKPVVGVRYVRYYEDLSISGRDILSGTTPRISSTSHNNLVGPQAGVRMSYDNQYFSLGLEPKLMLGINRHQDKVRASSILDPANPPVTDESEDTDFAPVFSLASYLRVNFSDSVSLYAGYELLALTNVTRPADSIFYDSPLVATDPIQIGLRKSRQALFTHGLNVGGEIRFR
jgi:hypothetical protein